MARVTVEDCLEVVNNRFALSMLAGYRAREISKGAEIKVSRDKDKDAVVALREIAEGSHDIGNLEKAFIKSLQKSAQAEDLIEEETSNIKLGSGHDAEIRSNTKEFPSVDSDIEDEFVSVEDYDFEDDISAED